MGEPARARAAVRPRSRTSRPARRRARPDLRGRLPLSLRVLMTADTVGGVWTYTCELVRALAAFGVDVTIATMGREPTAAQRREADALPNARLISSEFALEWMPNPWRDVDNAG